MPEGKKRLESVTTPKFIKDCSIWCLDHFAENFSEALRSIKDDGKTHIAVEDVMQLFHIAHDNCKSVLEDTVEKAVIISMKENMIKDP